MADVRIRQEFRTRRVAGGALVFIGLPLTLIWVRFGLPPRFVFADLLMILAGPGMVLLGLWAAFPRGKPAVRLLITDDNLVVGSGENQVTVPLTDLQRVIKSRPLGREHMLTFETADAAVPFLLIHLTHTHLEIVNLVSMRLEQMGRYLAEGRTEIAGAPNGVWEVMNGNPFEKTG
jgi:hypothetical protein